ncbi:DUF4381 domain-containing protein [Flavobacteriaceae bacterium F89]|uniref:DUF4381 domain-containing protein n=1 Tax=Cerina litoralis TaxID=2874477 RepID=A0AAE3EVI2_9FLAO|nr:DUF4381 domain-containing protein [Cerina litoralis]MCG2461708.1 DUF4381 domain-containing protein [Cerina litoralis]
MITETLFIVLQDTIANAAQSEDVQLDDIMEPPPIPFSFDTVGWKVVFSLLGLVLLYIAYKIYLRYKSQQYRRDAVSAIEGMGKDSDMPDSTFVSKVLFLIKQTALRSYNRIDVAALNGKEWLLFLDQRVSGVNFIKYKEAITSAAYKDELDPDAKFDKGDFARMSIKWIEKHAR